MEQYRMAICSLASPLFVFSPMRYVNHGLIPDDANWSADGRSLYNHHLAWLQATAGRLQFARGNVESRLNAGRSLVRVTFGRREGAERSHRMHRILLRRVFHHWVFGSCSTTVTLWWHSGSYNGGNHTYSMRARPDHIIGPWPNISTCQEPRCIRNF